VQDQLLLLLECQHPQTLQKQVLAVPQAQVQQQRLLLLLLLLLLLRQSCLETCTTTAAAAVAV
jgi:hypothetical protein